MGGGIGMGNTCKPMAVSFQCMTKITTNKKKKKRTDVLWYLGTEPKCIYLTQQHLQLCCIKCTYSFLLQKKELSDQLASHIDMSL